MKNSKTKHTYAPVNGLNLYYEIHGQSSDPQKTPLVLIHGGGSTLDTSFGKLLPLLAKTRKVIAFDQQGHGRTADIADRPFSFEQSAEDTVALLRYLKIEKADFLGYSNGGHITLELALRHPGVIRKMIVESAMFSRDGSSDPQFWEYFKHANLQDMPPELKESYMKVAPNPDDFPTYFHKGVQRMLHFKGWTAEQIRSIPSPTLVLLGDRDVLSPEHGVQLYRLLPNAQLSILPGVDHMSIVNRAAWVVPIVEAFLEQ